MTILSKSKNRVGIPLAFTLLFSLVSFPTVQAQQTSQKSSSTQNPEILNVNNVANEGLGSLKLAEKPVELLGGYLAVRMPKEAKAIARPFPIMGAPEPDEHETRVIVDAGKERMVVLAKEQFALAGDDFEKEVKTWVQKWRGKYKFAHLPLAARDLKAVSVIPIDEPDRTRSNDATFVEGIFLQSAQRTIQSLDVYINSPAEKDLARCKLLAHEILLSVVQGKRIRNLTAGERRLGFSKDQDISVKLPKNAMITKQLGPDFVVHHLTLLGSLGAESGSVLIYVGLHPSFKPGEKKGEAKIFGKQIEWRALGKGEGLQTLCAMPSENGLPLKSHIILRAPSEGEIKILKETAESLDLVKTEDPARK